MVQINLATIILNLWGLHMGWITLFETINSVVAVCVCSCVALSKVRIHEDANIDRDAVHFYGCRAKKGHSGLALTIIFSVNYNVRRLFVIISSFVIFSSCHINTFVLLHEQ